MRNKQTILILVLVALVSSSGFLLYRSFSSQPLASLSSTVSSRDTEIRSSAETLKVKINKAIKNLDAGGSLDQLVQSPQYQELSSDPLPTITIGQYGRGNPFVPPQQAL